MRWQIQEAKQRFSEVIRAAIDKGPQFITRHGEEVAVVMSIEEYRRLTVDVPDLRDYLLYAGPRSDDLEIPPRDDRPRDVELEP